MLNHLIIFLLITFNLFLAIFAESSVSYHKEAYAAINEKFDELSEHKANRMEHIILKGKVSKCVTHR